jgi:hypothetical protein
VGSFDKVFKMSTLELTDEEQDELEQLLIDITYPFGPFNKYDYNLSVLFDVLTKVETLSEERLTST